MKKYILLFLTAFVFTSGGCGGSYGSLQADSPEGNNTITISAPFDSNGDGVHDVFGYYPEGWSSGQDDPADGEACTVPYLNYIDSSDTDIDGTFTEEHQKAPSFSYVG
ncbi:MAG: hypothetical protein IJP54_05435 [Synergistaceae bacterium]|nr:hypothetical protein [Synergistaceae bacterium]MBR0035096.1 hypothetical protein [Synergistaceae bacterium]